VVIEAMALIFLNGVERLRLFCSVQKRFLA
jgi:hypothetical protein